MPPDRKLSKSAGEHHVCSELARREWASSLTRDGLERTDILAVHTETRAMIEIQVKSIRGRPNWLIGTKAFLPPLHEREWFVMVELPEPSRAPRTWILPRAHLSAAAWIGYHVWLHDPNVIPGSRNTPINMCRVSPDKFPAYEGRWDLLHKPTDEAPVMLPTAIREGFEQEGLPEEHPWLQGLPDWTPVDEAAAPG